MTSGKLENMLNGFDSISLNDLNISDIRRRHDAKYLVTESMAFDFLYSVMDDYRILDIDSRRCFDYDNIYFDTKEQALYMMHHNGHLNRFKLRLRRYLHSNATFFEIKKRNNKKLTEKIRFESEWNSGSFSQFIKNEIKSVTGLNPDELIPTLQVKYKRVTLFCKTIDEKITIDTGVQFIHDSGNSILNKIAVIEHKYLDKNSVSSASRYLRERLKHNRIKFSKYCIGLASTVAIKNNRFKAQINKLSKMRTSENG